MIGNEECFVSTTGCQDVSFFGERRPVLPAFVDGIREVLESIALFHKHKAENVFPDVLSLDVSQLLAFVLRENELIWEVHVAARAILHRLQECTVGR